MLTRPAILDRAAALGHAVFVHGDLNLNLIGVRSPSLVPDAFDDALHVVYRERGAWVERVYACTTDPGLYWLRNPGRIEGTAILAPGQYRGCWGLGLHRGQYPALVQVGPVAVYRDANRDGTLDPVGPAISGMYGINCHASDSDPYDSVDPGQGRAVARWSAGCTVLASSADFRELMTLARRSAAAWGPRFTYTLISGRP